MMQQKPTVVPGNGTGESSLGLPDPFEEALGGSSAAISHRSHGN